MAHLSTAILLSALVAPAVGQEHFVGEITVDRLVWELALHLPAADCEAIATVDLFSDWTMGESVRSLERDGQRVTIALPAGLGDFRGAIDGDRLSGPVVLPDGRTGQMRLLRRPVPRTRAEEVTLRSDGIELAGTIGLPDGAGPHPAVVFAHGGGDSSRDRPQTRFLAEYLPRFGIACLVYDKRGNGASQGNWREIGFEPRSRDLLAGIALLRRHEQIDANRVGVFAGSQGTWVATIAAARGTGVAFIVHHSGPAVSVLEADTFALLAGLRRRGLNETEIAEVVALWQLECGIVRRRELPAESAALTRAITTARARSWFERAPYEATASDSWWLGWYPQVMDYDPIPDLERTDVPMLWLYGAQDSQSDPVRNAAIVTSLARDLDKPFDVHVFAGAGHGIMVPRQADGTEVQPLTMATGYFTILRNWIHEH